MKILVIGKSANLLIFTKCHYFVCHNSLRQTTILQNSRFRRDARTLDEEEELWFEQEDECEDGEALVSMSDTAFHTAKVDTELDSIGRFIDSKKGKRGNFSSIYAAQNIFSYFFDSVAGRSLVFYKRGWP